MVEFSRKFGFPLALKFAFREDGHVIRTLADLKWDQNGAALVIVSSKPDLHILTQPGIAPSQRRVRSSFLIKQL